ncbi:MAG: DUF6056 family protein [Solobacterium sp.]|nr:DUF6056 family protein [Solobacterium sp.]
MHKLTGLKEKQVKTAAVLIAAVLFVMLFIMYLYTDFFADDLVYMNKWESAEKLSSVSDVIYFQVRHYLTWGGRTVAHTILQFLFLMPKPVSAFLNAGCFFVLAYMICLCAFGKVPEVKYAVFVMGLLYYINPYFEETLHWYTGMANYLWTSVLILITAYPFFCLLRDPDHRITPKHYLLLPVALLGGWTNENMAPSMVLFMMAAVYSLLREKKKVPFFCFLMILFSAAGCSLLILAPGNFVRSSGFSSGLMSIAYRGHGQVNAWADWLFMPLVITAILYGCNLKLQEFTEPEKRLVRFSAAWFVISVLAMLASPSYPQRATFGSFVILLVLIVFLVKRIYDHHAASRSMIDLLCLAAGLGFVMVLMSIDILAYVRSLGVYIPN